MESQCHAGRHVHLYRDEISLKCDERANGGCGMRWDEQGREINPALALSAAGDQMVQPGSEAFRMI